MGSKAAAEDVWDTFRLTASREIEQVHESVSTARESVAPIDFRTRYPALDGIRALAILMVFANHFGGGAHGGRILSFLNDLRTQGWMGVNLFFALSGFLITGILYDTRDDSHFFKRFFARRALRIFPVFLLVVALLLLLTPIFRYQWRPGHLWFLAYVGNLPANQDFTLYEVQSGNHPTAKVFLGHFWSLFSEEQFYLLWPLVVWRVRDRVKLLWVSGGLSALALLLRGAMVLFCSPGTSERWIFRTLPFQMDSLLLGGMLALLLRGPMAERWGRWCTEIFALSGALLLLEFRLSPSNYSPWLFTVGLTLIAVASTSLVGMMVRAGSGAGRVFGSGPMRVLGRYSYGFYVYHVLFGWAWIQFLVLMGQRFHSLAIAGVIALGTNFVTTFVVSMASFELFERRFLAYKGRFEYDAEVAADRHAFQT